MAIAFDAYSGVSSLTSTSLTFSATTSGSDRILFVMGHDKVAASTVVTGVTYNGVAMTQVNGVQAPSDRFLTMWYLVAPATGSNNVVVSASESVNLRFSAISYTGVQQTDPLDGNDTSTGSSVSTISTDITTAQDKSWMLMFIKDNNGTKTYSSTTGDTMRLASDAGGHAVADTGAAITPAGSNTVTLQTDSGTVDVGALAVAFKDAAEEPVDFIPKIIMS